MLVPLPLTLTPGAPFPFVVAQSATSEFVAPGVSRATYRLQTSDGPLVIHVVAIDPHEPTVRLGAVVASDRMISRGETLSSMARRTNAVAGVNADYFDIGNTYQPLNVVVRDGNLLRTPSKRVALDVRTDRSIHFENIAFTGTVKYGATTLPLTGINEWPPQGGATILTPTYGMVKPAPGVSLAEIVPSDVAHDPARIAGAYRVASVAPAQAHAVAVTELGIGPAAAALGPLPAVGDALAVDVTTTPPLDEIACAVGGGPLLVSDGVRVDDPNSPAPEERDRRFPVSGAMLAFGGELLLVEVDGRSPALSIGLTRPQFAALALEFGATSAMAFDSGGSSELVARSLGERDAAVFATPSDGEERSIADGLFVYSDAPIGAPSQLVVRPATIVAIAHASVPVRAALVDAAGHALGDVHLDGGDAVEAGASSSIATVRAKGFRADIPIDVVPSLARLELATDVRDPEPGTIVHLSATGFDDRGRVVALGNAVTLTTDRGTIAKDGTYRAQTHDATIAARAGGARATLVVRVGHRVVPLPIFDRANAAAWRFASAPPGAARALAFAGDPPELSLPFDFTHDERASYALAHGVVLPGAPLAFSVDVASDVRGVGVRASFVNRLGELRALTLAKNVDWDGFRTRTIAIPNDLNPPVRLVALYAVDSLRANPIRAAGTLRFRNASATLAGNP